MDNFDLKKFLVENKLTNNSRILEVDSEEAAFDSEFAQAANDIANAIGAELKNKDPKQLDESIIGGTVALVLTTNAVIGFISKYSAKLFRLLNYKKGEDIAEKIHHWAHDNEKSFQAPIKRILSLFVRDPKTLDLLTKAVYALVVGSMAAGYGAAALDKLSHADWFQGALSSLKTVAKSEEAIVNAYPAIRKLFV
jgi:hypothetical protein